MTDYPPPPPGNYPPPPGNYPPPPPGNYPPPPPPGQGGYGYSAPAPTGTNGLAIASLVCSVIGLLCGVGSIVGVILGIVALGQIKKSGQQGRGLAIAGIAVGAVFLVIGVIVGISMVSGQ